MGRIDAILVDLDGVLADFLLSALNVCGRLDLYDNWPPGHWDIVSVLGVTANGFWSMINARGYEFWAGLPAYPWTHELWERLKEIADRERADLIICTAPSLSPDCLKGKAMWMKAAFGHGFNDYIITGKKHLLASARVALIDDREATVVKFSSAGGHGILFPSISNAYEITPDFDLIEEAVLIPLGRLTEGIGGTVSAWPTIGIRETMEDRVSALEDDVDGILGHDKE